jgi:hypothetical protein
VFVTYPAEKSVNLNASGNVTALGTIASGTWQGSTIGVAYGGTGVTSSSGANSVVLRDSNANVIFNNFIAGFTAVTAAAGTTVLTVASTRTQVLVGSTTQTIQLPDATTLQLGHSFIFVNNSSGVLTITNNASATLDLVPSGGAVQLGATSIATVAGTWGIYSFLPGTYNFSIPTADFGNATITNAVWNGTTIGSAYGGTGLTTFTAANNALFSTSASALTAGTLPVAAGGTGTATAFTAGSVLFAGVSGVYSQDNGQLFWDDTNNRLGIGTPSPGIKLDLQGTGTDHLFRALNTGTAASDDSILLIQTSGTGATNTISGLYFGDGDSQSIGQLQYRHTDNSMGFLTNSSEKLSITSAGFVGINTTNPATVLDVNGNIFTNGYLRATGDGTAASPSIQPGNDADTGFYRPGTNIIGFTTAGTERMQIDASGLVGIGKTPSGYQLDIDAGANNALNTTQTGLTCQNIVSTDASASGMNIQYFKDSSSPANADSLTLIRSFGRSSTGVQREYSRVTTTLSTVTNALENGSYAIAIIAAGTLSTKLLLANNSIRAIEAYTLTTASAANMNVDTAGVFSRSTSSIRYKTQVEDLAEPNSANIYNMRPVWYRSTCNKDNKNWSYYGLIAEEVAELDPRLVHWGYGQDQYEINYIETDGQKEEVKTLKEDAELQPEGVQYDRLTVLLIQEMKALKAKVDSLEAEVKTLKNT